MNILFVCTWNVQRSKTAEVVLRKLLGDKEVSIESAGIAANTRLGGRQITSEMVQRANIIFVMEFEHEHFISRNWPNSKTKIINLEIDDVFLRGDLELVKQLTDKLSRFLDVIKK